MASNNEERPVSAAEANAYAEGMLFRLALERDFLKRDITHATAQLAAVESEINRVASAREAARERLLNVEASVRLLNALNKSVEIVE